MAQLQEDFLHQLHLDVALFDHEAEAADGLLLADGTTAGDAAQRVQDDGRPVHRFIPLLVRGKPALKTTQRQCGVVNKQ